MVILLNSRRSSRALVLLAILVLALNLRTAPASLGVLLSVLRDDLAFSPSVGGVLTTLPLLCFAVFGGGAIRIVSGLGLHRTTLASLVVMIIGLVLRASAQGTATLIVASVIALSGAAIGNVLLPPLVKFHFPRHVTLISSLYTSGILIGATLGSVATVPVADAYG
ncbi:MAG TPA: MFS transporter, partial [Aeromicrobium sp.]|nr:MFS transporter [Aeromicrobium sp.]